MHIVLLSRVRERISLDVCKNMELTASALYFVSYVDRDVPLGQEFTLYRYLNEKEWTKCNIKLDLVIIFERKVNKIAAGWKTVCRFNISDFDTKLTELPEADEWVLTNNPLILSTCEIDDNEVRKSAFVK